MKWRSDSVLQKLRNLACARHQENHFLDICLLDAVKLAFNQAQKSTGYPSFAPVFQTEPTTHHSAL